MQRKRVWWIGGVCGLASSVTLGLAVFAADKDTQKPKPAATPSAPATKSDTPATKPATGKPATEKPATGKPAAQKPAIEKSPTAKPAAVKTPPARVEQDPQQEAAVKAATQRFADAFNKRDLEGLANLYHPNATLVTVNGTKKMGHDDIVQHFATLMDSAPESEIKLKPKSVQFVTADVAIEEGELQFNPGPEAPLDTTHYVAVYVKTDGEWLLDRTRNFPLDHEGKTHHERLLELEWMVGEWLEEDDEVLIATTCRWSADKNYLLQDFKIRTPGFPSVSGNIRIGWDPLTRQIKSWTFDSDGGYSEALWTHGTDHWILKTRGVTHLGKSFAGTSVLRHVNGNTLSWEMRDRVEGGTVVPDRGPLLARRQPPPPAE
ncbi:MAG: SgcJ/EcaC family oxidoreductase [Planctomycetes bacterium]|nr:SgcJ/EcaC family oxidoreductase [Planctomycetota bacterium]